MSPAAKQRPAAVAGTQRLRRCYVAGLWAVLLSCAALNATANINPDCLKIEQAYAANDVDSLVGFESDHRRWLAHRDLRLAAALIPRGDHKAARRAIRRGLSIVSKSLKQDGKQVEMLLLGAMLDGQYQLIDRWRFLHNGVRALNRLKRAERLEQDNPRVGLIRGAAELVIPGFFGGSPSQALSILKAARNDAPLCENGEWAQPDILTFIAKAHEALDQPTLARQAYEHALDLSPNNHWVESSLAGNGYDWSTTGNAKATAKTSAPVNKTPKASNEHALNSFQSPN